MATHSTVVARRIPWPEEPGGLHSVHGVTESQTQLRLTVTGEIQQFSIQLTSRKQQFSERNPLFLDGFCEQSIFQRKVRIPNHFARTRFMSMCKTVH